MNPDFVRAAEMLAMLVKTNPGMLAMARQQPHFSEIESTIVALIANADTTAQSLVAYAKFGALVPDWKFIFASESGPTPGFAVNQNFSDGSVVRGLFSSNRVLVLDPQTLVDMRSARDAVFPLDYSISLDTQALSYLTPYIEGRTTRLPKDFHEIFSFISRDDVAVDPIPYCTENLPNVLDPEKAVAIRRRLAAYEILRTFDAKHFRETRKIRSTISQAEQDGNVGRIIDKMIDDASDPDVMSSSLKRHTLLYCILLKMTTIQLRSEGRSHAAKLHELAEFMDTQLRTIFARELIVASEYFARGQSLKFFKNMQKKPSDKLPELLDQLANMAWDFWHIRHIEEAATIETTQPAARYFFPALLTCDKGFIEIIDLYPLKSCAYQQGSGRPVPFPAKDWIAILAGSPEAEGETVSTYYSREAQQRRESERERAEENLPALVRDLELDFAIAAQGRQARS